MAGQEWFLFTPHLPTSPSSLRVLVWRRMQTVGAVNLQSGVWVLPRSSDHERFIRELLAEIEGQGGSGLLFVADAFEATMQERILARFQAERERDYHEFEGRCKDFLLEIDKETSACNFTFAELEENEQDLLKLAGWLRKIQSRDFFHSSRTEGAVRALTQCRETLHGFANAVYLLAGLAPSEEALPPLPDAFEDTDQ